MGTSEFFSRRSKSQSKSMIGGQCTGFWKEGSAFVFTADSPGSEVIKWLSCSIEG
jgi:hypothetical protein